MVFEIVEVGFAFGGQGVQAGATRAALHDQPPRLQQPTQGHGVGLGPDRRRRPAPDPAEQVRAGQAHRARRAQQQVRQTARGQGRLGHGRRLVSRGRRESVISPRGVSR